MDKLREEFEQWFFSEMEIDVSGMRNEDPSTSAEWPYTTGADESSLVITVAFKAWQASRASIVVELPRRQSLCAYGYGYGYFVPSDTGEGLEYEETVEAIRSIGLSIKGSYDEKILRMGKSGNWE